MGFPWTDNHDCSVTVHVVADTEQQAKYHATRLAQCIWDKLEDFAFQNETLKEAEALDKAFAAVKNGLTPVYLSDSGDNPTAGASSDNTTLLGYLMGDKRTQTLKNNIIYGGIFDPEAVEICKGNEGKNVDLVFGAKFDKTASEPIRATGFVKKYIENWTGFMSQCALALVTIKGVDVVLASAHIGFTTPEMYEALGRNVQNAEIVVCKLGYLTEQHEAVAKSKYMVLTKGNTNEDLSTITYKHVQRPIYPLDAKFDYNPEKYLSIH